MSRTLRGMRCPPLAFTLVIHIGLLVGACATKTPVPSVIPPPTPSPATASVSRSPTVAPPTLIGHPQVAFTSVLEAAPSPETGSEANGHHTLFSIPIGKEGVRYEGQNVPEKEVWGPQGFTVAPDGAFWIVDSVGNRLLHYDATGHLLDRLDLDPHHVVGAADVAVTDSHILVLAISIPMVYRLSTEGESVARYTVPPHLEGEISGITVGDHGEVILELGEGRSLFLLVDADGKASQTGYYVPNKPTYASIEARGANRGHVVIGDQRVEIITTHALTGLRVLGITPAGSFYVRVSERTSTSPTQVSVTLRHYSTAGQLLGVAHVPVAEQHAYVPNGLALGPEGDVYALITLPDRVEIQRIVFRPAKAAP